MSDLHALAEAAGLHAAWQDAGGKDHVVGDDTLRAILTALDVPADHDGQVRDSLGAMAESPLRCPALTDGARIWAAAVQIPSLRGHSDTAFGDFGALADAAGAFGRRGAQALAISPVHALFPADPARFSPYAPSSRLFLNVWLADPARIGAPYPAMPAAALIDWQGAVPERMRHLRAVWGGANDAVRDAVAAFRAARGDALEAHARFDALHAQFAMPGWREWPETYRDPAGDAVRRFAAEQAGTIGFYVFLQWLADAGLAAAQAAARETMAVGLIADLAVGVDAGGSQTWCRRGDFLTGLTIGAPPDPLGPDGQNWGITAFSPFALRRTGCAPLADTLRAVLAHAGGIRVDHALGLARLWVIPDGAAASEGAYLTMPLGPMLDTLAREARRAGAIVIGEDLGTVPPGFRDTLHDRGLLGMAVLPFERDADGVTPARDWNAQAAAMTGTHDTATLGGWWTGRDIDWTWRLGRSSDQPDEAADRTHRDADRAALWSAYVDAGVARGAMPDDAAPAVDAGIRFAASAPGPLAIVPVEDLAALPEQPNLPGTTDEHPNWRRRLPAPIDALLDQPAVAARIDALNTERPA